MPTTPGTTPTWSSCLRARSRTNSTERRTSCATTTAVAADLGYKIALNWSGQLEEYPQNRFDEKAIVELARTHFKNRGIVLCHANAPAITHVYGQLVDIIRERSLRLVTLNDVLLPLV